MWPCSTASTATLASGVGAHVPLVGQHRLDHHAAAVAVRHRQVVRFDLVQQAQLIEGGNHRFTRREALQAAELGRDLVAVFGADFAQGIEHFRFLADVAVEGQDVDHRQVVAMAHFVVVEVVRRGDLHAAGAFFHVGVFVADDPDAAVDQRQNDLFADQVFIAWVFRVDRHAGIAQQGFRTGGGDHQVIFAVGGFRAVGQRVAQVPQVEPSRLAVFHFQVGNGGAQLRIPVHQALAAVDQAFFVQAHEDFFHRVRRGLRPW